MSELKPVAWLYDDGEGSWELIADPSSPFALALIEQGYTGKPLYGPEALEAAFRMGLAAAAEVAIREGNEHLDPENWEDWDDGFCAARTDIERAILAIDPAQHLRRE